MLDLVTSTGFDASMVVFAGPVLFTAFPLYHLVSAVGAQPTCYPTYRSIRNESPFSVVVPCYNEQSTFSNGLHSLLSQDYGNYEIIFVNDGSTDNTLQALIENLDMVRHPQELAMIHKIVHNDLMHENLHGLEVRGIYKSNKYPNVSLIDKPNGGKATSLNVGFIFASNPYIITLDADSLLHKYALRTLDETLHNNENVIAIGGMVKVLQGTSMNPNGNVNSFRLKSILKFQTLEYWRAFFMIKYSLAKSKALTVISGAFGTFRRDVLLNVGGFRKTVGEDMDITIRMHEYVVSGKKAGIDYNMLYVPEAICYTEAPEGWKDLTKQRLRWQRGFIDCFFAHWKFFVKNPLKSVSIFFTFDSVVLGLVAAFVLAYSLLDILLFHGHDIFGYAGLFLIVSGLIQMCFSIVAIIISRRYGSRYKIADYFRIGLSVLVEQLGYKFFLVVMIVLGTFSYFITPKHGTKAWKKVVRTGKNYVGGETL